MPKDAPLNSGAPEQPEVGSFRRVSEMQAKLHRWASADRGRRFDDLFNLVHDPATLRVAWERVATNSGARTAGSDGVTVARIEREIGALEFLGGIRGAVKDGSFRPQPVRERLIPKPGGSGKVRRLGIPTVTDRVVQAALKLVLEPIFEADFHPVSFGFRPKRRAHDAIADIHLFGSRGYEWVLDADIEACFDTIDHVALLDRVRARVTDKRVLTLVKSFLKAGILTELGEERDTPTGTPQGGILSPLLANIALSVLDEYLHRDWRPGGWMSTENRRHRHRRLGLPTWRLVRYADDFVVMVFGTRDHVVTLREEVAQVLAPMGLRLSPAKTRIVHIRDGFDFLGFRIRWRIKKGTRDQWRLYTFIGDRPLRSLKARIRALTRRTSQQDLRAVLIRINRITRGWLNTSDTPWPSTPSTGSPTSSGGESSDGSRPNGAGDGRTSTAGCAPQRGGGRSRRTGSNCATSRRHRSPGTVGAAFPAPGPARITPNDRSRGEPVALKGARRVRRAAWGNRTAVTPELRPRPTRLSAHFAEIYGASVSKETVSRITDKVVEEMYEWANRPLDSA